MSEQIHPQSADLTAAKPGDVPVNGTARDPFWAREDVLEVGPREREVIDELRWAHEREADGAFAAYAGKYLGIVNRIVQAVGGDPARVIDESARKAAVPPERVALFHVEMAD